MDHDSVSSGPAKTQARLCPYSKKILRWRMTKLVLEKAQLVEEDQNEGHWANEADQK
jgi:hypothetical protein